MICSLVDKKSTTSTDVLDAILSVNENPEKALTFLAEKLKTASVANGDHSRLAPTGPAMDNCLKYVVLYDAEILTKFLAERLDSFKSNTKSNIKAGRYQVFPKNFIHSDFSIKFSEFCQKNKVMETVGFDKVAHQLDGIIEQIKSDYLKIRKIQLASHRKLRKYNSQTPNTASKKTNFILWEKNLVSLSFLQKSEIPNTKDVLISKMQELFDYFQNFLTIDNEEVYESTAAQEIPIALAYDLDLQKFYYDRKATHYALYEFYLKIQEKHDHSTLMAALQVLGKLLPAYNKGIVCLAQKFKDTPDKVKNLNLSAVNCIKTCEDNTITSTRLLSLLVKILKAPQFVTYLRKYSKEAGGGKGQEYAMMFAYREVGELGVRDKNYFERIVESGSAEYIEYFFRVLECRDDSQLTADDTVVVPIAESPEGGENEKPVCEITIGVFPFELVESYLVQPKVQTAEVSDIGSGNQLGRGRGNNEPSCTNVVSRFSDYTDNVETTYGNLKRTRARLLELANTTLGDLGLVFTKEKIHDLGISIEGVKVMIYMSNIQKNLTEELKSPYCVTHNIFNIDHLFKRFLEGLNYVLQRQIRDLLLTSRDFASTEEDSSKTYFTLKNKQHATSNLELTQIHRKKTFDLFLVTTDPTTSQPGKVLMTETISSLVWLELSLGQFPPPLNTNSPPNPSCNPTPLSLSPPGLYPCCNLKYKKQPPIQILTKPFEALVSSLFEKTFKNHMIKYFTGDLNFALNYQTEPQGAEFSVAKGEYLRGSL